MRPPLKEIRLRTAESDHEHSQPSKLNAKASPLGGSFGPVRSSGTKAHQGWDMYAEIGTEVYAITAGIVEYTGTSGDYGNHVCLRLHSKAVSQAARYQSETTMFAFYAHLSVSFVRKGQAVLEGDVIGLSGNTGNASNTPPHLHFEVRTQSRLPKGSGLKGRVDPGEVLGYDHYSSKM